MIVEKNNFLISVIVPVYNVEKYINRCIDSILSQTYGYLEIILVDDGSKDSSGIICDAYKKIDSRIKVIHKENGGLSSSRNIGLDLCKGDYICFIDSDDWIAADTIEHLLLMITKYDGDCAQIGIKNASTFPLHFKQKKEHIRIFEKKDILQFYMLHSTKTGVYSVCICLFQRKCVEHIRFREGFINEDIDFKYKALSNSNKLIVSNQIKYFYFQGDSPTISSGGLREKDFQLYDAAQALYDLTKKETYGSIAKLGRVKRARSAFSLLSKIALFGISDASIDKKAIVKKLTKEHRKNCPILINSPIAFNKKVLVIMFALSFSFTEFAVRLFAKLLGVKK